MVTSLLSESGAVSEEIDGVEVEVGNEVFEQVDQLLEGATPFQKWVFLLHDLSDPSCGVSEIVDRCETYGFGKKTLAEVQIALLEAQRIARQNHEKKQAFKVEAVLQQVVYLIEKAAAEV